MREATTVAPVKVRRHDIDRLRILAVLLLFPFHSARVFDLDNPWYVKNPEESPVLSWSIVRFLDPWHMPLLFVLAGAATWYALGHRSSKGYIGERVRRLLIPFLFAVPVIVPIQSYLALRGTPGADHSFVAWAGDYWKMEGDFTGYDGGFTPGHMWFVMYLFLFSLIGIPLFAWLHRRATDHDIGRVWMLVAMPFVMLVAEALPSLEGAWSPFTTFALFVAGFVLMSSARLQAAVRRAWPWFLFVAVGTMAGVFAVWASDVGDSWADGSWQDGLFQVLEGSNTWLWVLGTIGAAGAWLARPSTPLLRYANEAAYPWYILHQTVIVVVAYAVVGWGLPIAPAFAIVLAASVAITLLLYDLMVRRTNVTRFLFGLKPLAKPSAAEREAHLDHRRVARVPGEGGARVDGARPERANVR